MYLPRFGYGNRAIYQDREPNILTEDEINAKVAEAEEFASEDKEESWRNSDQFCRWNGVSGYENAQRGGRENLRLECRANPYQARRT